MGITERHWFEDEEPELTEQQLEDIVAENQRSYEKGYADAMKNAVPLDKLCEWLANGFSDPPCCTLENVQCKMECRGFTQMDYSECWRHVLTKWMEGLNAEVH